MSEQTKEIVDCWNRIGVRGDQSCERLQEYTHCRNCDVFRDAAVLIMERDVPSDYRRQWTEHFTTQQLAPTTQTGPEQSAFIFRIGAEWLALPVHCVVTVAEEGAVRRVPHREGKSLLGVVNVKGKLYPCMALDRLLRIDPLEQPVTAGRRTYPRLLLVRLGEQEYALPVQDLHGIHRYHASEVESAPATTKQDDHRLLTGVLSIAPMRVGFLDNELLARQFADDLK